MSGRRGGMMSQYDGVKRRSGGRRRDGSDNGNWGQGQTVGWLKKWWDPSKNSTPNLTDSGHLSGDHSSSIPSSEDGHSGRRRREGQAEGEQVGVAVGEGGPAVPGGPRRPTPQGRPVRAARGRGHPVYLCTVLEYLGAEAVELAGNAARDNKKTRITPRHIQLAVRNDEELSRLLGGVTIAAGGVLPNINSVLLPKKAGKAAAGTGASASQSQEF
ncbi:hypothetical protein ZWY2020_023695 [Hordeum vulgare]|nr:hypothetical protein ZWY2020_023695 [Hordeum vulgare]